MKFKILSLVLFLLLTLPPVGARSPFQITYVSSTIKIWENYASETITLDYVAIISKENASDTIMVLGNPTAIGVYDNSGRPLRFETIAEENFTAIDFFFASEITAGEKYQILVELTKPLTASENGNSYMIGYRWSTPPMLSRISALLPKGAKLLNSSPSPSSISSQDDSLNLKWVRALENQFLAELTFQPITQSQNSQPSAQEPKTENSSIYILITATIVIILAVLLKPRLGKREVIPQLKTSEVLSVTDIERILNLLTEPERAVIKELLHEDNLLQKTICERTGIPKATISRTMKRLEAKGLVKRTGFGAGKRAQLTRWGKKLKGE